jgi:FtsP/CotA-like multicopper oxidase with cupredoxin domain
MTANPGLTTLLALAAKAPTRIWEFDRSNGAWQVNGRLYDPSVINEAIVQESEEVWVIRNGGGGWAHPVHPHFEEHRVLSVDGVTVKPNIQVNATINYARRDVVPLDAGSEVRTFRRFRDMAGTPTVPSRYVMHCHNVVHEDHAMMVNWDIVPNPKV